VGAQCGHLGRARPEDLQLRAGWCLLMHDHWGE
jgi:hypothetical protein